MAQTAAGRPEDKEELQELQEELAECNLLLVENAEEPKQKEKIWKDVESDESRPASESDDHPRESEKFSDEDRVDSLNAYMDDMSHLPSTPPLRSEMKGRPRFNRPLQKTGQKDWQKNSRPSSGGKKKRSQVARNQRRFSKGDAESRGDSGADESGGGKHISRRKKSSSVERRQDRDYKRSSSEYPAPDFLSLDAAYTSAPLASARDNSVSPILKIDSTTPFRSLRSLPVSSPTKPELPLLVTKRQSSHLQAEVPQDLMDFHKTFSLLIRMGAPKKTEDHYLSGSIGGSTAAGLQPNKDPDLWQTRWNELLWLELRAWHRGQNMQQQDDELMNERQKIPNVLAEFMQFKIRPHPSKSRPHNRKAPRDQCSAAGEENRHGGRAVASGHHLLQDGHQAAAAGGERVPPTIQLDSPLPLANGQQNDYATPNALTTPTTPSTRQLDEGFSPVYLRQIADSMDQVMALLDRLESIEQLYPTHKGLSNDKSVPDRLQRPEHMYGCEAFNKRLQTLCLWYNITKDLRDKADAMKKFLGMDDDDFDWPAAPDSATHPPEVIREDDATKAAHDPLDPAVLTLDLPTPSLTSTPLKPRPPSRSSSCSSSCSSSSSSSSSSSYSSQGGYSSCSGASSIGSTSSLYRPFVSKELKQMGIKKLIERLRNLLDEPLQRAKPVLMNPNAQQKRKDKQPNDRRVSRTSSFRHNVEGDNGTDTFYGQATVSLLQDFSMPAIQRRSSLVTQGSWSQDLLSLGLPSFRPLYLILIRIPLDVMHECIKLRLEYKPPIQTSDLSIITIKQMIRECRECILGGVAVKQYYQEMVQPVIVNDSKAKENFEKDIDRYEEDVKDLLKMYFTYLQESIVKMQGLPEVPTNLLETVEEEWAFIKEICPHIREGEVQAGQRFCALAKGMVVSTKDYLNDGMDDVLGHFQTTSFTETLRRSFIEACRKFKQLYHETKERAVKSLAVVKMLTRDLEIASEFQLCVSAQELLKALKKSNHVRVQVSHHLSHMVFIPAHLSSSKLQVLQLLNTTCDREDIMEPENSDGDEGYVLLLKSDIGGRQLWDGTTIDVQVPVETTLALAAIEITSGLLLVVNHSSNLYSQRKVFQKAMGKTVDLVSEQRCCHPKISWALEELKEVSLLFCDKISTSVTSVDETLLQCLKDGKFEETEKINLQGNYRETLIQCYNIGFEYHKEVSRIVTGEMKQRLGNDLLRFAKKWMDFVLKRCEKGRGTRPRWANQGLDFLITASEPRNLVLLDTKEFQDLKSLMNNCITHLIGSHERSSPGSPAFPRASSPQEAGQNSPVHFTRMPSWPNPPVKMPRSLSRVSNQSESPSSTPSPPIRHANSEGSLSESLRHLSFNSTRPDSGHQAVDEGQDGPASPFLRKSSLQPIHSEELVEEEDGLEGMAESRQQKIRLALQSMERKRDEKLHEDRVIGSVCQHPGDDSVITVSARKVTFRWQRGVKIGEGQFGIVYSCITDTGDTMAMKAIKFQRNDQGMIKDIADEIKNFEGINHPNLVKYYGVEVHRDELLVFMEYCDEGTIADVCRSGLPEPLVKKYTHDIVAAINQLHKHGIIHRDIKGANIFLTLDGHIKLGDFGCAVKLKKHSTMVGEINNTRGTAAYMAPEVITQVDKGGYGRAADIWSLGCTIIEMVTGKRPWHEYDNDYAVIYRVGMGSAPPIPDKLSLEGKDFLGHTLKLNPSDRWSCDQLLDHPFVRALHL